MRVHAGVGGDVTSLLWKFWGLLIIWAGTVGSSCEDVFGREGGFLCHVRLFVFVCVCVCGLEQGRCSCFTALVEVLGFFRREGYWSGRFVA
jgi:hypothetical protein